MYNLTEPLGIEKFNNPQFRTPWHVPPTARMIYIWGLSGGGGGGGGCSGPADTQRGGGSGGAQGNHGYVLIPSFMCSEMLFVTVGRGGAGGGPDTDGVAGGETGVVFETVDNAAGPQNFLLYLYGGPKGTKGTTTSGGTGAGTGSLFLNAGLFFSVVGSDGTGFAQNGGTTGQPGTMSISNQMVSHGTGGAGCGVPYTAQSGGHFFSSRDFSVGVSQLGGGGSAAGGFQGDNGYTMWSTHQPFVGMPKGQGGRGGGNANTGTGGAGGNGGIGSGGGGGGAGFTGGTGGTGGDGFVLIAYW